MGSRFAKAAQTTDEEGTLDSAGDFKLDAFGTHVWFSNHQFFHLFWTPQWSY